MSASDSDIDGSFIPLIDVLLVLLVSVLGVSAAGLGDIPVPAHPKPGPAGEHVAIVEVQRDGQFRLNGVAKTHAEIASEWTPANRPASVLIRAHEDAAYKHVRGVISLCHAVGIDLRRVSEAAKLDTAAPTR